MKRVAFICVHNSCRSQIAEALGNHLAGDVFESYSAGTETKPKINQDAVRIMKQLYGIDMEKTQYSKLVSDIPEPDIAISMGCNVGCPFIGRPFDDNWGLDDPTGKSDSEFIKVIQEIEKRIFDSFADEVKKAGYTVVPFAQAQKDLRIYLREEADTDTQREQDLGVVLKSKDFKALAAKENVQYVLLVSTRTTSAEVKANFFTGQRKNLTVLTNIVLYDAKAGDYLADQSYTEIGKTSGSYDRAYSRATNKLPDKPQLPHPMLYQGVHIPLVLLYSWMGFLP